MFKMYDIKLQKKLPRCICLQEEALRAWEVPSAVAFGAALSVGAVRAGFRRARGISDGSESPVIYSESLFLS